MGGHGAFELGIDVDALEIVWDEVAVQIDTHAPTPAPTPPPTPANATGAPDESTRNAGIFSYLMGSLPGGQDSSVGIGVLASFGALLVCGATYATYVRVQHPSRQKGALSTKARQGGSGAANYAPEPVTPKTKTTSPNTTTPNTTTPNTTTPTTATPNAASAHENGRNPLPQFPPDLEDGNEAPLGTKEV